MLELDLMSHYVVYPSWANLALSWNELAELIKDPSLFEAKLGPLIHQALPIGEPSPQFPKDDFACIELIPGPGGNGIIRGPASNPYLWHLVNLALHANSLPPTAMMVFATKGNWCVPFLEPIGIPSIVNMEGQQRSPSFVCPITAEHVESSGNSVHWVLGTVASHRNAVPSVELLAGATGFGFAVRPIVGCPIELRSETQDWFSNRKVDFHWYHVRADARSVKLHFAVLLYMGLHLRWVMKSRMAFAHLLAQVPGKPLIRKHKRHW